MVRLDDVTVFVRTADRGSLSAAARELEISPALASAAVKRLEGELGIRLFARTTRSLRLTDEANLFQLGWGSRQKRLQATLTGATSHVAVGIAGNKLAQIFERFTQADSSTTRRFGGSGLGLHIVHNLVHSVLGGRIEVHSRLGAGASFSITLPMTAPERVEGATAMPISDG